jgi:hypothetical protein
MVLRFIEFEKLEVGSGKWKGFPCDSGLSSTSVLRRTKLLLADGLKTLRTGNMRR